LATSELQAIVADPKVSAHALFCTGIESLLLAEFGLLILIIVPRHRALRR